MLFRWKNFRICSRIFKLVSKKERTSHSHDSETHPLGPRLAQEYEKDQESRLIDETVKDYALEIHSRRVNTYRLYETVDEAPTSFSDSEINPRSEAPLIVSFGARRVSREVGRSSSNGWIPPSPPYPESSRQRSVNNRGKR